MKILINLMHSAIIVLLFCFSFTLSAKPNSQPKSVRISIPLSDNISHRYEKYLLFAYNHLGYKVTFDQILIGRARELVDEGKLDGMMIAEKEIEQTFFNLLRVPVVLAKGALVLYCNKKVVCEKSVFNDVNNIIGVTSGKSISANFMETMQASSYAIKSDEDLGSMLIKGRLHYVLLIDEVQLGNLGNFDESQFNTAVVYRSEGFHYVNKKHEDLLPALVQGLQLAIEKYGPLVNPNKSSLIKL